MVWGLVTHTAKRKKVEWMVEGKAQQKKKDRVREHREFRLHKIANSVRTGKGKEESGGGREVIQEKPEAA